MDPPKLDYLTLHYINFKHNFKLKVRSGEWEGDLRERGREKRKKEEREREER